MSAALSWEPYERVSDRYGTVGLVGPVDWKRLGPRLLDGMPARLYAAVVGCRMSQHVGDLFRGLVPPRMAADRAPVGSTHLLGVGRVFYVGETVGVNPEGFVRDWVDDQGTDSDWLNPGVLYLLHEQEVALKLEEIPDA